MYIEHACEQRCVARHTYATAGPLRRCGYLVTEVVVPNADCPPPASRRRSEGMQHSQCSPSDTCVCDWRYLPPDCAEPFYAPHLAPWLVFRYSAMSVHGGLTALGLLGIWAKYRIHQRRALAHSAGIVSVSSTQHVSELLARCLCRMLCGQPHPRVLLSCVQVKSTASGEKPPSFLSGLFSAPRDVALLLNTYAV